MFLHQQKFIDRIIEYLREELGLQSTDKQMSVLRAGVADRVGGIINGDDFHQRMGMPFEMGGAAYGEHDAYLLSRYMEKLIAQGAYTIQQNELLGAHS